ncbi:MAG: lysophospholipid acyltransferase family protein [Pigmentiphaga sp.]|nr:lysophospholipid acyltransferase family protein [Pigmentiphaga sp.]
MLLFVYRMLACLPLSVLHGLGRGVGWLLFTCSSRYRRRTLENARLAGHDSLAFGRRTAMAAGESIFEVPHVWFRPAAALAKCGTDDWAVVETAMAEGKGILFLTPHIGCFEVAARYVAERNGRMTVLYRPPRKAWMREVVERGRRSERVDTAPANLQGVRQLVRALRRNETIGILPDQVPSTGEGVWAPFFGKPAFTMVLPGRLAKQTGTAVILAAGERLPQSQGWKVHCIRLNTDLPEMPEAQAAWLNQQLEAIIQRFPEQYLWSYNRYKVPAGVENPPQ